MSNSPSNSGAMSAVTRQMMVDDIMNLIYQSTPVADKGHSNQFIDAIVRNLSRVEDNEYLERVLQMVTKISGALNEVTYWESLPQLQAWLQLLADRDDSGIMSLCAHEDYLAADITNIDSFVSMRKNLSDLLGVEADDNGFFSTIEAHIDCEEQFHKAEYDLGWSGRKASYPVAVARLVELHPDKVDALISFIYLQQDIPELADFEEYLSHGVLREGML